MNREVDIGLLQQDEELMSFLEEMMQTICSAKGITALGVVILADDGTVTTGYHNAGIQEMALMMNAIDTDRILRIVGVNGEEVQDMWESGDDTDDTDDTDGEQLYHPPLEDNDEECDDKDDTGFCGEG